MFQPMALTVIIALLGALILSLTFVPALISIFITGKVAEQENCHHSDVQGQPIGRPSRPRSRSVTLHCGCGRFF